MQVEPLALGLGLLVNRISTDNTAILAQIAKKQLYVYYLRIHQQPKYEMARNLV
jgi:hypothetical protein